MRPGSRKSSDVWLAVGLITVLTLITIAAAVQQTREQAAPPLAAFSSAPDGARALQLWLAELDYTVREETLSLFRLSPDIDLIFMLEPFADMTPEEWTEIDTWVENGGTLVLAGNSMSGALALGHYDFSLGVREESALKTQTPLWLSPPLPDPLQLSTRFYLRTRRTDFVTHLADEAQPVVVSFAQRDGRVILSASIDLFTNAGLKEKEHTLLLLNIVSGAIRTDANQRPVVWFNEWHHGVRAHSNQISGPDQWLRRTPAGQSLLYTAVVLFLALALQGRRFGRPVPVSRESGRRAPLEFITAIANLNRRAGHRTAILAQYHQLLKRDLGRRYRLNPTLPDDVYLAQLATYNPALDTAALGNLLTRLHGRDVSEREMVELAAEVAVWLDS